MLMKEIKDGTVRWKDLSCFWIGRISIVKMTALTQGNLQIQCNPCEIISGIFQRTRAIKILICVKTQKTLHSQSNLETERWN